MSHFSVMVIAKCEDMIEDLLAPYDENIEVEPYIYRTKEKMIQDAKTRAKRIKEALEKEPEKKLSQWDQVYLDAKTDEDFYNAEKDTDGLYDEDGNELTTYNPKSKWDWYSIGGRWGGGFKTKDGEMVDYCKVKDLDTSPDKETYDRCIRFWEVVIEGDTPKEGEDFNTFYKKEYYTNRYKDKYHYARNQAAFSTFAAVTPDGQWHEQGKMGWWGMSDDDGEDEDKWIEGFQKMLDEADPDYYVYMVDCHI